MLVEDLVQGSPEWLTMRVGMCTGSNVAKAVAKMKKQPKEGPTAYYACREEYLWQVVTERLTGKARENYVSLEMEWGIEHEPVAIAAYEAKMECEVEPVGFAFHPTIKWFGASPDGLVGSDGCIEVKCPTSAKHLQYILDGCVPDEYLPQMKAEMACAERQWCDFISYDPRMPKDLRLFVRRLEWDAPMIKEMEEEVVKFLAEVDAMMDAVKLKIPAMILTGFRGVEPSS